MPVNYLERSFEVKNLDQNSSLIEMIYWFLFPNWYHVKNRNSIYLVLRKLILFYVLLTLQVAGIYFKIKAFHWGGRIHSRKLILRKLIFIRKLFKFFIKTASCQGLPHWKLCLLSLEIDQLPPMANLQINLLKHILKQSILKYIFH